MYFDEKNTQKLNVLLEEKIAGKNISPKLEKLHHSEETAFAFLRFFIFFLAIHKFDVIKKASFDAVCQVESLVSHKGVL